MLSATKVPQLTILDVPYGQVPGYSPGRLAVPIAASSEYRQPLKQRGARCLTEYEGRKYRQSFGQQLIFKSPLYFNRYNHTFWDNANDDNYAW
ncbi:Uncharacterised protein [Serratia quinivorans]|nr:Uncharacterised protein [Serratia quinivorans]CAI1956284.1 Uncharacterised protein [Serratia quinivorans]